LIAVSHFSDPGCPWAWSAAPSHAVLAWRYGAQLSWRHVLIGLSERAADYDARGYRPESGALGYLRRFSPLGMPFDVTPRPRNMGTGLACRAVVATRLRSPEHELPVFRALQAERFTTTTLFDTEEGIRAALARVPGLDADTIVGALADADVEAAYQEDRALTRRAAGTPAALQGRTANTDGAERYTAPTLVFRDGAGRTLEVGGFQHVDSYDNAIANLDPRLERRGPGTDVVEVLRAFPYFLSTREVAAVMAPHLTEPDDAATEAALISAAAAGHVRREPAGNSAFWHLR
jgi:2-hydroxychromene-2-carboxylate isomerase